MSSDVKPIFHHQRVLICIDVIFDIAMFRIVLISFRQCYIYAGASQQKRKIMSETNGAWINNLSGESKAVGSKTKSETICFERSIRTTMDVVALGGYPVMAVRQHIEVTDEDVTRAIEPDAITVNLQLNFR